MRSFLTFMFGMFLAFLIGEILVRIFIGNPYEMILGERRVYLYSTPNFQMKGDVLLYHPEQQIKVSQYITSMEDNSISEIYSHDIITNNLGLVQKKQISNKDSIHLFLGDSFTEGEGITAWFYDIEKKQYDLKMVNGGIKSTGPQSWEKLKNYLESSYDLNIKKITVILIGGAIKRGSKLLTKDNLACLNKMECENNWTDWIGYDYENEASFNERINFVHRTISERNRPRINRLNVGYLKRIAKKSALIVNTFLIFKQKVVNEEEKSYLALERLANLKDMQVNFVLIPQKQEYTENNELLLGADSKKFMAWASAKMVKVTICDNLIKETDYIEIDGHPNELGGRKIMNCVWNSIN